MSTERVRSYPKVYNLGHRAIRDLLLGPVAVQEKVDGSQFSFGIIDGGFAARSRGQQIDLDNIPALFAPTMQTALAAADAGVLVEGHIYRGEAMKAARHNTLTYERAPQGHFVLFDIDVGLEDRLSRHEALEAAADAIGCEVVPLHFVGEIHDLDEVKGLVAEGSFLGGSMEGLVFKNYARFGVDGKMLMGKYVTDAFREAHAGNPDWKPKKSNDILAEVQRRFTTEARWEKAIQHLAERGELQDGPQDIGPLILEIQSDVMEECRDEIADMLLRYYEKKIRGGLIRGFPEWYKERLAQLQFTS